MKFIFTKIIYLFLLLFAFNTVFAQAPQKMSYQAVIRNTSGNLIVDTPVGIKIAILQGSTSGTEVFSETHNPTTSSNGLASIEIGAGTPITGTFATINWGLGPFFIKTETDPTGGTNYTISGTSQLLSVPYALYAEKTKFQGRNSIYIQDNISNAQAQAILQEQFGPSTENIYIKHTKGLTNLDLSMVTNLANLEITNNKDLVSVNANNLYNINNQVIISNNLNLAQLNFLSYTKGNLTIISNPALLSFDFPQYTEGNIKISSNFIDESALTSFSLTQFTTGRFDIDNQNHLLEINLSAYNFPEFFIYNCNLLNKINLPNLTNALSVSFNEYNSYDLPNLKTILLPALVTVSGSFIIHGLNIQTLSISALTSVVNNFEVSNTKLIGLEAPSLVSVALVTVKSNNFLQNVNFGSLVSANAINCSYNPLLTSINLSSLSSLAGSATNYSYFALNALPSSQINALLHQLLTVSPSVPKIVGLDYQTPLAPPTGVGIADKATLISQGNNITTD